MDNYYQVNRKPCHPKEANVMYNNSKADHAHVLSKDMQQVSWNGLIYIKKNLTLVCVYLFASNNYVTL